MAETAKTIARITCPTPHPAKDTVVLGHGSGGGLSADLIRDVFLPAFQNPVLDRLGDQAIVNGALQESAVTRPERRRHESYSMAMNRSILRVAKHFGRGERLTHGMLNRVEAVIRAYHPCLSCTTHAWGEMPLVVQLLDPSGEVLDEVRRPC